MTFSRKTIYQKQVLGPKSATLSGSTEYSTRSIVTERTRTTSRPVTPSMAETRKVIQKEEWLEAARRSTEHFKRHGSPVPLVWVLTQGRDIPDNAVPFGEDRNGCTTYIARALVEGNIHIGKASPQFAGAVIGYAGKDHIINNYEVLVCASQLRWGFSAVGQDAVLTQGTVVLAQQQRTQRFTTKSRLREAEEDLFNLTLVENDIPRFIPDEVVIETDREVHLRRFAEIKTVIVIDDSMSMQEGNLWEQAREALAGIVDIANQYGSKGCDIHFMHVDEFAPDMLSRAEVVTLFNRILPEGEDTPTGGKLGEIIGHYLPRIEQNPSHEPITVVVVTDGLPTDQDELERVIVDAAHRLDRHRVKHDKFGIQFVQIGTDPAAAELLHKLDDHLVTHYNIRDMVDSTPFDPAYGVFDTDYMLKILLGGLNRELDRAGPNAGQPTLLSPLGGRLGARVNSPRLSTLSPRLGGY